MEPMALGSPSGGSPATNPYLPSFLLGEQQQTPNTPRNNTLSPNKAGRNLSFGFGATSPSSGIQPNSPQDYNRSVLGQKTLFGGYQQTPPPAMSQNVSGYAGTPMQNHNASISGPPTQGLFDSLRTERNQVQTPTRLQAQAQYGSGTPSSAAPCAVMNQSIQQQQQQMANVTGQFNDSYLSNLNATNTSFNMSRTQGVGIVSPLHMPGTPNANTSHLLQCPPQPRYTEFWITVFGFPPGAASAVLQHFAQCGTIVDKIFPSQNGNWVHIKYSSRLECDKALNYNEKILANNIMIGVTQCKDRNIIDKENLCENSNGQQTATPKIRPLVQTAYMSAQNDSSVVSATGAPQKSSGLMNKAMDLFFGW